jgi:hypothetical protein
MTGMRGVKRKRIPAFCLFLFIFCGCSMAPAWTARMNASSPEAALSHLDGQLPAGISLQALANIQMTTPEGRYPLKLAILLKRPAWLRVEAIPLFGPPSFFLSVHDQMLKVFLAEPRTYYVSRATMDNIARYLPLKMDPEDMIAILMGTYPSLSGQDGSLEGRPEGDHYRINMGGAQKHQSLWVRMTDGFLERIEVYQDQHRLYQVHFEEPLPAEGAVIPQTITIVFEGKDSASFRIRYTDIRLLKTSDTAMFDLKVPPGIKPIYLD